VYQPRPFVEADASRLHDLIEAHSFGTLIVSDPQNGLEISHLPFLLDRASGAHGRLRVHVARANPIWRAALSTGRATVVFMGPHAHVSASWYAAPSKQVPTWNYAVVHAHGSVHQLSTPEPRELLQSLASVYERPAEPGGPDAWSMDQLDSEFVDVLLAQIVGLSIEIDRLEGTFKLSQNRSAVDRARVIAGLRERAHPDDLALAELMAAASVKAGNG
jgi:transcriptional regulator